MNVSISLCWSTDPFWFCFIPRWVAFWGLIVRDYKEQSQNTVTMQNAGMGVVVTMLKPSLGFLCCPLLWTLRPDPWLDFWICVSFFCLVDAHHSRSQYINSMHVCRRHENYTAEQEDKTHGSELKSIFMKDQPQERPKVDLFIGIFVRSSHFRDILQQAEFWEFTQNLYIIPQKKISTERTWIFQSNLQQQRHSHYTTSVQHMCAECGLREQDVLEEKAVNSRHVATGARCAADGRSCICGE